MKRFGFLALAFVLACDVDAPLRPLESSPPTVSYAPRSYIVQLRTGTDPTTIAAGRAKHIYRRAINGFAADLDDAEVAVLRRHPAVTRVTPDGVVQLDAAPWNLDRIDQRSVTLDGQFSPPGDGAASTIYIVDTGIRYTHAEFGGRATFGYDWEANRDGSDCNGHGTHVAGTAAGATLGVARAAHLVSVRVFPCGSSTETSIIIAALDWLVVNAVPRSVANMSFGAGAYPPLDDAVQAVIDAGVVVVVSAGNESRDACLNSPARVHDAITLAATDENDVKAYFSNFGPCVDLWAPGVMVLSAYVSGDGATATLNGTSMSAPHATGVAALIRTEQPSLDPAGVADLMRQRSTKRIPVDPGFDGDLVYSGLDAMPIPPGTRPSAWFTHSCIKTTCSFADQSTPGSAPIVAWQWGFSVGAVETSSTLQNPSAMWHQPGQVGTSLVVTDANGLTSRVALGFSIEAVVQLGVRAYRQQGSNRVDLTWSLTRGDSVMIIRTNVWADNPSLEFRRWYRSNTGTFTDTELPGGSLANTRKSGRYEYYVCELTSAFVDWQCSALVTAVF